MKVLIAIPTYDRRIDIEIVQGLLGLERSKVDFDLVLPVSSHISRNRNYAVHVMLKGDYDYLLFWDSDIGIDEGFMTNLLDTAYKLSADIVGGAYRTKESDLRLVAGMKLKDGKYDNLTKSASQSIVDAVGTGIMLIRRKVLEKMPDPWFTIIDSINLDTMPEDFEFCRKAQELGFTIALDGRSKTRHYGSYAFVT